MSSRFGAASAGARRPPLAPGLAVAQDRIFPDVPSFERPEASPRVHGIAARVLSARRGDSRFGNEPRPRWRWVRTSRSWRSAAARQPITLGFGSQVYARFSLSDPKSALISHDWVVGLNATAALGALGLDARARTTRAATSATSTGTVSTSSGVDWTREVLGAGGRATTPALGGSRGSASYVLLDELRLEPPGLAFARGLSGRRAARSGGHRSDRWRGSTWRPRGHQLAGEHVAKAGVALQASPGAATRWAWRSSPTTGSPPNASSSGRRAGTWGSRCGSTSEPGRGRHIAPTCAKPLPRIDLPG